MPAAKVLRPGDTIVSVDGVSGSADAIRRQIGTHRCAGAQVNGCLAATPATVVVRRDGRLLTFEVRPQMTPGPALLLGFDFGSRVSGIVYPSAVGAASGAGSWMWYVSSQTVSTIARIFEPKDRKQLSGVVGGYTVTQQSFAQSATRRWRCWR